jgi:prepilin-type N-terminal cleavage/methylation domain-containing protein
MQSLRVNNRGLTLMELLLSTALLAVISFAVYTTLDNGINIFRRIQEENKEEEVNLAFDDFASTLRNACSYKEFFLKGTQWRLEFPAIVYSARWNKKTVGKAVYFFDAKGNSWLKEEQDFSHMSQEQEGRLKSLLNNVKSLQFKYYFFDKEKKEYLWLDESGANEWPLAVRIEVELEGDDEDQLFSKTVNIPVAQ